MRWVCQCGNEVDHMAVLWEYRTSQQLGHRRGRNVAYECRIGCVECVSYEIGEDDGGCYQHFPLKLSSPTKRELINQVLAQAIEFGSNGYLPKTDIRDALVGVYKECEA